MGSRTMNAISCANGISGSIAPTTPGMNLEIIQKIVVIPIEPKKILNFFIESLLSFLTLSYRRKDGMAIKFFIYKEVKCQFKNTHARLL
jgi:hypothetical protein